MKNGTIQNGALQNVTNHLRTGWDQYFVCLSLDEQHHTQAVFAMNCTTVNVSIANQKFETTTNSDGSVTIKQNGKCLDNNYVNITGI
jgi:hypothetical protein